ncbi:MAG: tetratricopeptide repeat protein [Pseudohongiellaceae bacterium]
MTLTKYVLSLLVVSLLPMQPVFAGEEEREPPAARSSDTLSDQVFRAITSIQELMNPEDENDEPDFAEAKEELDELRERRFERMNDFEKATTLNFYTQYYLSTEDIPGAIRTFEEMLTIEDLRPDTRLRALRALGQLSMSEENFQEAINYYEQWREVSEEEDAVVYLGLANSHYSLDNYQDAVNFMILHMNLLNQQGETIERNKWAFLNSLYFALEQYDNALDVTRKMIIQYNDPRDWTNLGPIYSYLDEENNRLQALKAAYLQGFMDSEAQFMNLAQSLAGEDIPYTGSRIMLSGIEQGFVEETADNLQTLVQMYLLAYEYDMAVEPATRAAEISGSGDDYDTLGYIYYQLHDYDAAVEAFRDALATGNLSNESDTALFLARSLVELDRFDESLEAARRASDAGDSNDRENAQNYIEFIENTQQRHETLQARKEAAIDFYIGYND